MQTQKITTILLITLFTLSAVKTGLDITQNPTSTKLLNTTAQTTKVIDGDTIDIKKPNGQKDTVRTLGIDTPETQGQNKPKEYQLKNTSKNRRCLQKIGEKATRLVKNQTQNQTIQITQDPKADKRGSYGRLLAYIQTNQTDISKQLLQKGYARVYNTTFSRIDKYRKLETQSRREGRGIWSENCGLVS